MITPPVPSPHSIPVYPSDPGVITEPLFLLIPGCYNLVVSLHQAHNFVNPLFDCFELAISFLPDLLTIKKKNIFFYIFNKYLLSTQFKSSHCSSNWRYSKGTSTKQTNKADSMPALQEFIYWKRRRRRQKIHTYIHTYLLTQSHLLASEGDWLQDLPHQGYQNQQMFKSLVENAIVFAYDLCTSSLLL